MIPLYDYNPTERPPVVTRWLILVNVLVFLLMWLGGDAAEIDHIYGFVPARAHEDFGLELPHVLTSMFLHANVGHLAYNMLYLHIFGDNVEDVLGRGRYLLFYVIGGLGAAVGQYLIDPASPLPMIGASGAIFAVLGAYLVLYPRAPVVILTPIPLFWLISLPAWAVVGLGFFLNVLGAIASLGAEGGGVAFFAHLAGFVTGLLLTRPLAQDRNIPPGRPWSGWKAEPRPAPRRKIFWKNDDRPFWR